MGRRPARVTQADLTRAIRAVTQAGADMVVEVLPDGTIRISRPTAHAGGIAPQTPERTVVL